MGLDQYLYHCIPDIHNPDAEGVELAYWRKDWELQHFLNSDNCEDLEIDLPTCDYILSSLDNLYLDSSDDYREYTKQAFTRAKKILLKDGKVIYNANW